MSGAWAGSMAALFDWVVRTSLQASVLVVVIVLCQRLLSPVLSARWRHALWLVLLARLAMPWAPGSPISLFNLIPRELTPGASPAPVTADALPATPAISPEASPTPLTDAVAADAPPTGRMAGLWSTVWSSVGWRGLWLAGVVLLAGSAIWANVRFWLGVRREPQVTDQPTLELLGRCKRVMKVHTPLVVVETKRVQSPSLFGFVRPRLLLPSGMSAALTRDELGHVFMHELAHLRRGDIFVAWLATVLQIVHWFNPVIWYALSRMRGDRELASDALVLSRTGASQASSYGRTIVTLLDRAMGQQRLAAVAGLLENRSHLRRRITMIARFGEHSAVRSALAAALLVLVACVGLTDAKSAAVSEPAADVETYVVTFQAAGDFSPKSAGALLDAFNENHPKGVRTHHFNTKYSDGRLIGSIHVDGDTDRDAVVKYLATSSRLELLKVTKTQLPQRKRTSGRGEDTHIVFFAGGGDFEPQTAAELLGAFNENHPGGVRTHHFRTRVERRDDEAVLVGSICVDSKADADTVAEHVKQSERLEFEKVLKPSAEEWGQYLTLLGQPSLRSGGVAAITKAKIHPGRGLDVIHVGDTIDAVTKAFGEPWERTDQKHLVWLDYRRPYSMDFLVDARTQRVTEIRFNKGFAGALANGLKIGSSLDDVLAASGGAFKTVDATRDETHGCKHGRNRVLYRQRGSRLGAVTAYKFVDGGQGVLFWFDRGEKVTQIVVFRAKGTKAK